MELPVENLLRNVRDADVRPHPFPYLVVKNALGEKYYQKLSAEYPDPRRLAGKRYGVNNCRFDYPSRKSLADPEVSEHWRGFIRFHRSAAFFREVARVFARWISPPLPKICRAGIRGIDDFLDHEILVDALISGNTPAIRRSSVRTTHVDLPSKLFAGLFYLRHPDDDSRGGDLEIHRPRGGGQFQFHDGVYVAPEYSELHEVVPYAANTLVLFLNSPLAWHAVSARWPTPHPRRFVNIVGEFAGDRFDLGPYQPAAERDQLARRLDALYSR